MSKYNLTDAVRIYAFDDKFESGKDSSYFWAIEATDSVKKLRVVRVY